LLACLLACCTAKPLQVTFFELCHTVCRYHHCMQSGVNRALQRICLDVRIGVEQGSQLVIPPALLAHDRACFTATWVLWVMLVAHSI
jgi:hypothetical protein